MPTLDKLTADQANFDNYLGAIQRLEERGDFNDSDSDQAINTLSRVYHAFQPYRESGDIDDGDWKRIEELTSDRATAYRASKGGEQGRFSVMNQYQPRTSPQGDTPEAFEDWINREKAVLKERSDAPLYRDDFEFAAEQLMTQKIRAADNEDGSFAPWDWIKRAASGAAGTTAMAFDQEGDATREIERFLKTDPARDSSFMADISQGLGSVGATMGVFLAGTGITRNPIYGGTAASLGFNGMIRYNEGYQKAKSLGAPEMVASTAGMYSTPGAFVDTIGDAFLGGRLGQAASRTFRLGGSTLPRKVMLNRIAKGMTEQAVGQSASEVSGDLVAAAGQARATGDYRIFENALAEAPRTAAVSAVIGGLLGGAGGIREASSINTVKAMAEEMDLRPEDVIRFNESGQFDFNATSRAIQEEKLKQEQKRTPEPLEPETGEEAADDTEATQEAAQEPQEATQTEEPQFQPDGSQGMDLKDWSDYFEADGTYTLGPNQRDAVNTMGAEIDRLVDERDQKERAGVPLNELKRYDEAMMGLVENMVNIADQTELTQDTETQDFWADYERGGEFRSREEALERSNELIKKSPLFDYRPKKNDPGDGTAFNYTVERRPKREFEMSGETIARARDVETAFRDQERVREAVDSAIEEVENNNAAEVTASTINKLMGLPPASMRTEYYAGPYELSSDVIQARQSDTSDERLVARKQEGQWYLHKVVSEPQEGAEQTEPRDAFESARFLAEASPVDPTDLIPGEQEFADDVESKFRVKARNRSRPSGSVLLPNSDDVKQAARDGANFFRNGIQKFTDWSSAMVEKWGNGISDYLNDIWESIKESFSGFLTSMAEPSQVDQGEETRMRSGLTPEDIRAMVDTATSAVKSARDKVSGTSQPAQAQQVADKPVQNRAQPPQPENQSTDPGVSFRQGWRRGVRDMRDGMTDARERLQNLLKESGVETLTRGEFNRLSTILERRNLTPEDTRIIEEMGEQIAASILNREQVSGLKSKRRKARRKANTENLGVRVFEQQRDIPTQGADVFLSATDGLQPVNAAKALVAITPGEAARVNTQVPGFLDAYEGALDSIIDTTRAPNFDPAQMTEFFELLDQNLPRIKKMRTRAKMSALRGYLNKAKMNGDDVASLEGWLDQLNSDLDTMQDDGTGSHILGEVENGLSAIESRIETLPSTLAENEKNDTEERQRRDSAIKKSVRASKKLGDKLRAERSDVTETSRKLLYESYSDLTPKNFELLSTNDIEAIPAVIEQISELVGKAEFGGIVNTFTRRIMSKLAQDKIMDRYPGAIEKIRKAVVDGKPEKARRHLNKVKNSAFFRYLTEQQFVTTSELNESGLTGAFGSMNAQNLLFVDKQLGDTKLIETEYVGRTNSLQNEGQERANALLAPIRQAVTGLKKGYFNRDLSRSLSKKGLMPKLSNERNLLSQEMIYMGMLVRQLDNNDMRSSLTERLNVDDPMIQWIEGGHEKGASPNSSSLPTEDQQRLLNVWETMKEVAGGQTWSKIQHVLTEEQKAVMSEWDKASNVAGASVRATSAVMRNVLLPSFVSYFPLHGSSNQPPKMDEQEILNARLDPGIAFQPNSLRPSASHLRTEWVQPQNFSLEGVMRRHLTAVFVDSALTPHIYVMEGLTRRMRDWERSNGEKTTSKWQNAVGGLRRMHRRIAGLDIALSAMYMSGAHRGISYFDAMLRRSILAQVHKPLAEGASMSVLFSGRLGAGNYSRAVRNHTRHYHDFLGLMLESNSSFPSRQGMNSADYQSIDQGSLRGARKRSVREEMDLQNIEIRPGMWGWIQETDVSKLSNYATRFLTSIGDHMTGGPAMYHIFMKNFKEMTGKDFNWNTYNNKGYDKALTKEVMLKTDIEFQKIAAPNTAGLVSELRNQSNASAMVRAVKRILFPYSHFASNEKANLFQGVATGFNSNLPWEERRAGFTQAATHAGANLAYQLVMYNIGKILLTIGGGAIADALAGDDESEELARRMQDMASELGDPEMQGRRAVGSFIDAATGAQDPISRGMIGWLANQGSKAFTENVLDRPFDEFDDSIVYVRDVGRPEGALSYVLGPYTKLIEDSARAYENVDYLLSEDEEGGDAARVLDTLGLAGGYIFGLPGQATVNKVLRDSTKTYSDPDYKEFDQSLKTKEVYANVRFIVDKRDSDPEAFGNYLRLLTKDKARDALKYYKRYAKDSDKKISRDLMQVGAGVIRDMPD